MLQMINYKPTVYNALKSLTEHVYDEYPASVNKWPVIIYADENNTPYTITSEGERFSEIRFRIEIHSGNEKTTDLMLEVNEVMTQLGFKRIFNQENVDSNGRKMRTMRFEAKIDNKDRRLYY